MAPRTKLQINSLPQFRPFFEKHRYKVAVSGRASGKSVAAADAQVYFMMKYPVKILNVRQFQNSIADSSYQQIIDRIEDHGLESAFEITRDRIKCKKTGAYAIFRGLDRNIRSIKSIANIDICCAEEAETISDESWEVLIPTIMRNTGAEMWVIFNPKLPSDPTAQRFLSDNPLPGTVYMRANYDENPYLDKDMLEDINHMKTTDYKRYRHVYRGEFEDVGDTKIFPLELVREAIDRDVLHVDAPKIAALDVARFGDDSSVLLVRQGNKVLSIKEWKHLDTVDLTNRVATEIMQDDLKVLVIDNGGGHGSGPVDMLKRLVGNHCRIVEFVGARAANDNRYLNSRAETHFQCKEWLTTGCIPSHPELIADLTSLELDFTNSHQIKVEDKKEIKKRLGRSTDYSDPLTMTFYTGARVNKLNMKKLGRKYRRTGYHWV